MRNMRKGRIARRGSGGPGFSLVEILIALMCFMFALVGLFSFFTASNRGSLDAHRETIAHTLAREGLEWVAGIGYERLLAFQGMAKNPLVEKFSLGSFVPVDSLSADDGWTILYPEDYRQFERKIELIHHPGERLMIVRVTVQPRDGALRRKAIVLEKVAGAEYD